MVGYRGQFATFLAGSPMLMPKFLSNVGQVEEKRQNITKIYLVTLVAPNTF